MNKKQTVWVLDLRGDFDVFSTEKLAKDYADESEGKKLEWDGATCIDDYEIFLKEHVVQKRFKKESIPVFTRNYNR